MFGRDLRDQVVDKGDMLKVKIPFSGTGPFDFKVKKGGREVPDNSHIKLIPFDDYVILQINEAQVEDAGKYAIEVANKSGAASLPLNVKVKGNYQIGFAVYRVFCYFFSDKKDQTRTGF